MSDKGIVYPVPLLGNHHGRSGQRGAQSHHIGEKEEIIDVYQGTGQAESYVTQTIEEFVTQGETTGFGLRQSNAPFRLTYPRHCPYFNALPSPGQLALLYQER